LDPVRKRVPFAVLEKVAVLQDALVKSAETIEKLQDASEFSVSEKDIDWGAVGDRMLDELLDIAGR
jgi:hypothetical protein